MIKRASSLPSLLAPCMALALASASQAASKEIVFIDDISYDLVSAFTEADVDLDTWHKGPVALFRGEGVLDCNGTESCLDAGLDGQTVVIAQALGFDTESFSAKAPFVGVSSAGALWLLGGSEHLAFKGRGDGTLFCSEGACDLDIALDVKTTHGGRLAFSVVIIHIDHTSAGIVADEMTGALQWSGTAHDGWLPTSS